MRERVYIKLLYVVGADLLEVFFVFLGFVCFGLRLLAARDLLEKRLGGLGQKPVRGFFFTKRFQQEVGDLAFADQTGNGPRASVSTDFVVLDFLRGGDEGQVRDGFVFLLALGDHFLTFFDETGHGFTWFRGGLFAHQLEGTGQPLDVLLSLREVLLETFPKTLMMRRFRHLRQCLDKLFLSVEQVLELLH